MKAVNLIPDDLKRGATAPTRSGVGVYAVLGALGLALVAVTAFVLTTNQVSERQAALTTVEQEAVQAEAQAARLKPYADFSALRENRVRTVASLAQSRFSWDRAMREMARVMPANVWLTSIVGTVAPGVSFAGGGGGDTSSLRGQVNAPAIEIVGCTRTQADVSRVMARLRLMDGVSRVTLGASEKIDSDQSGGESADGGAVASSSDDCRYGDPKIPKFSVVVFFKAPPAATPPPAAGSPPAGGAANGGAGAQPASTGAAQ